MDPKTNQPTNPKKQTNKFKKHKIFKTHTHKTHKKKHNHTKKIGQKTEERQRMANRFARFKARVVFFPKLGKHVASWWYYLDLWSIRISVRLELTRAYATVDRG